MRNKSICFLNILLLINGFFVNAQTETLTGLHFASHEVIKDKRTSLDLTSEGAFNFPKGFSMEFETKFRPGDGYYGYVFRIIGDKDTSIDLIANLGATSPTKFSLILEDSILFSYAWEDIPNGTFDSWVKIQLHVDTQNSKIMLSMNGNSKEKSVKGITDLKDFNMVFGACRSVSFLTTDVAPMTLRDIRIYNDQQEIFRNWKLSKHAGNEVYDEITYAKATVHNPIWEINKHLEWKNEETFRISNLIGVAEDKAGGRLFLINDQVVLIHDIDNDAIDTVYYISGEPFDCQGNQVIYNPYTDEIWSYNFEVGQVSVFDFETRTWSLTDIGVCKEPDLWHHNRFISREDTSLVTFGGYGFYTYKSLLKKLDPETGKWQEKNLSNQIHPRYMSALGREKNGNILVFGGYGSKSGRQELSPTFYYDLYSIDQKNYSVDKLWEFDTVSFPFVPCTNLVMHPESNGFFTLVYNPGNFQTSLRLAHFAKDKPQKKFYADTVSYKFLDTRSWSTLFLNERTNKLVALTVHDSEINLQSLAFPPLLPQNVYQKQPAKISYMKLWAITGILLMSLVILLMVRYKRKRREHREIVPVKRGREEMNVVMAEPATKKTTSSIYLLGGFLTYDKNGEDITSTFTPTLKQLFLLIFLSSLKNGKGVSSVVLKDTLWFDKSGTSARNNRNVNISKLRVLLEKIGDIELESNKTYWKINLGEGVYCDYTNVIELIEQAKSPEGLQAEKILHLIEIASSGDICPNIQTEWMDEFKASFANSVVDTLMISSSSPEVQSNNRLLCNIADCILKYDSLNEEAIRIKCTALYKMGKKGLAKHSFNSFSREYKNLLGDDVTLTFNKLIEQ